MILKAINPKNQSLVNKAINWLVKHNNYNTQRDFISGNLECDEEDSKEWRAIDKKCVHSFDMYLEYLYELPKGQQKAIETSKVLIHLNII